jgi:hypothetical protein
VAVRGILAMRLAGLVFLVLFSTYYLAEASTCSIKSPAGTICKIEASKLRPTQFGIGMQEVDCKKQKFEGMSPSHLQDWLAKFVRRFSFDSASFPPQFLLACSRYPMGYYWSLQCKPLRILPKLIVLTIFVAFVRNFSQIYRPEHYVPVITGLDNDVYYITDHHHQVRALVDADIASSSKIVYANITFNGASTFSHHQDLMEWMVNHNKYWLYDEKGLGPISPSWIPDDIQNLQDDFYRSLAYFVKHGVRIIFQ